VDNTDPNKVPDTPPRSEVGDTKPFQEGIATSDKGVASHYTIVVILVVKETTPRTDGQDEVKVFVDISGAGVPTQAELDEICEILKPAAHKFDVKIPLDQLTCTLQPMSARRRQVTSSYVSHLSYPSSAGQQNTVNNSSASSVAASLALIAVLALFFL